MFLCKSGRHQWLSREDARLCCNGHIRVTVVGPSPELRMCDRTWLEPVPGGAVPVGKRWVPVDPAVMPFHPLTGQPWREGEAVYDPAFSPPVVGKADT